MAQVIPTFNADIAQCYLRTEPQKRPPFSFASFSAPPPSPPSPFPVLLNCPSITLSFSSCFLINSMTSRRLSSTRSISFSRSLRFSSRPRNHSSRAPVLLLHCRVRHHAAVHRQPLGATHPGYGDGAVEGASGELLDLGRAAGARWRSRACGLGLLATRRGGVGWWWAGGRWAAGGLLVVMVRVLR
jgi:hypothetical protein